MHFHFNSRLNYLSIISISLILILILHIFILDLFYIIMVYFNMDIYSKFMNTAQGIYQIPILLSILQFPF